MTHVVLITAHHLLARHITYQDAGRDSYDRRHAEWGRWRAIHSLERQGFRGALEPAR